ncbi:AAA family ATPase [Devosia algicola]|uniref:AAA family ATPase n=1 Tax=Devosia algicola TaxID=3026418 RepID=A0ABY7YPD7_9HYPH|nr:AAA family ATPase [Devosia algicola]WDR03179.1 AAA family ATPase [Devosia algicola]
MTTVLPLRKLGTRIMVCGMSGAGKSTLTQALARSINATPVFLDTLYHQPGTQWEPRAPAEFEALHAQATAGDRWVMDGNYSRLMDSRIARATGIIWIDPNRFGCLYRYFRRSFFDQNRHGRLEGAVDDFTWPMVRHILQVQPSSRAKLARLFSVSGLPVVRITSMAELKQVRKAWRLTD